ncbi:MAG: alpha/beta fold hydrolase, partial [Chloroflexota bacterium]
LVIWQELLGLKTIGVNESFFALGGHSLLAIRLFNRIHQQFGKSLPLTMLFQAPSIRQLARLIDQNQPTHDQPQDSILVPIQAATGNGLRPPLFCVHGFGGGVVGYGELARLLGSEQPVYGLQALGHDGHNRPDESIEAMASRYIQSMKLAQPKGPYHLGGYCYGGVVAFEMARQLEAQGEQVSFVGIFEGYAPIYSGGEASLFRNPKLLSHWVRNIPYWLSDFMGLSRQQMLTRLRRKVKRFWTNVADIFGVDVDLNPEDIVDDTAELQSYQLELMKIHLHALREYDPGRLESAVTLFRIRSQALSRMTDSTMGWHKLAAGVDVRMIEGSHNNILEQPHVQSLAKSLKDCLK